MEKEYLLPPINVKPKPPIAGMVAIVTGASSGIGEATARELAAAGAKVVLAARRIDRLERTAQEISSAGGVALAVQTDLTEPDQIGNLVNTTLDNFGRIDILCNIAGWGRYDWLEELSEYNLRNQYDVNVIGTTELTRRVLPTMKDQRSGHIINISSYGSKISTPPLTVYCSTKYAIEGFTDGLRRELIPWGIHVSRVHPSGVTGTEFNQKAARDGGIRFRSAPIGKVTRMQVARRIVGLIEQPKRYAFLSRWYDLPVYLDSLFPALTDFVMGFWVRSKRRNEINDRDPSGEKARPAKYAGFSAGTLLLLMAAGLGFALRARNLPRKLPTPPGWLLSAGQKTARKGLKATLKRRFFRRKSLIERLFG